MQSSVRSHPALAEAEARERERTSPYEERAQVRILATPTTKMKRSATIIKAAFDDIILSFPVSVPTRTTFYCGSAHLHGARSYIVPILSAPFHAFPGYASTNKSLVYRLPFDCRTFLSMHRIICTAVQDVRALQGRP